MPIGDVPVQALVVMASGTSGGLTAVVGHIEEACRAGGRFAMLIDARGADDDADMVPSDKRRASLGRLRALRPQLKVRCAGVAFLVTADRAAASGRRLRAARLLLGCPVDVFGSLDAARGWLGARGATVPEGVRP